MAGRPEVGSRTRARALVDEGRVTVDGSPRPRAHRLQGGEQVRVRLPQAADAPPPEPVAFEVVHEDEHLLVVDKPAGVLVHAPGGRREPSLAGTLAGRIAGGDDPSRAGVVQRLDRDTSGLLVMARTQETWEALGRLVRERALTREYLALVSGRPESGSGTIDAPLGRDRRRRTVRSSETDTPREARTHFALEEPLPRTSLLRVTLDTGRTHQIRAHLAAIGLPVCGDGDYGGGPCGERLGLMRQFLHSTRLVFDHPITGENLACESKLPADLRRSLDAARREPASRGPDGG